MSYPRRQRSFWARIKLSINCADLIFIISAKLFLIRFHEFAHLSTRNVQLSPCVFLIRFELYQLISFRCCSLKDPFLETKKSIVTCTDRSLVRSRSFSVADWDTNASRPTVKPNLIFFISFLLNAHSIRLPADRFYLWPWLNASFGVLFHSQ